MNAFVASGQRRSDAGEPAPGGPVGASNDLPELTAQLETALLRELSTSWKQLNLAYFRGALAPPSFELSRARTRLGMWHSETRVLEIARELVLRHPWGAVIEVLKHEMAHQYVHEALGVHDETAHGPAFRDVCARLGIDSAASGMPSRTGSPESGDAASPATVDDARASRIVERIARLLALAESSNQHEAEAAMAAAQKLMLKYNLDVAAGGGVPRGYGFRHLGKPSGRIGEAERILAMLLGKHFFVEVIFVSVYRPLDGKPGSVLEICGSDANLAMAEYVHGFLTQTAEQLWLQHRAAHGIRSNRDRRVFLSGVMTGFAEKLHKQSLAHASEGLVWVKDGDLGTYFRKRHPYIRHVRHDGARKNEAYAHGKAAGRKIVLRRGIEGAPAARGRLLPSGG